MRRQPESGETPPAEEVVAEGRGLRTFSALGYAQYRRLWGGTFFTFAAGQMTMIARPWLAYELTDSAFWLGVVALGQGIPMFFMSPFGGVAADRLSKRTVLLVSQMALLAMALVLVVLLYLDVVEVWHLLLQALVHGTAMPFNMPVRQSYVPLLLPRRLIPNGVALQAAGRNVNQVAAPGVAGILLGIDPLTAFGTIAAFHVLSMAMSLTFPVGRPEERRSRGMRGELTLGFRYVFSTPLLRLLFGMLLIMLVLGMPYVHLLPVFQEVLSVGPELLGFMYATIGLGGFFGSLTVASFARLAGGLPQLIAGVGFGVGLAAFALSPFYALSMALLFCTGFAHQAYTTINQTLIITRTDPALYGRVMSINLMLRSFITMAILPFGALVDHFGAPVTFAVAGGMIAGSLLLIGAVRGTTIPEGARSA
ncbi:MAG: MFS transporter [Chloroflexota bacterium]|nr:MFS transporter [Chloroflexota bacterium]MDE2886414.1 MFS transporter [Chloroflexota bacterium]